MKRRLRLGLLALFSLVAACVFIAAASAQGEGGGMPSGLSNRFDPQETNIENLAWRGEEVRLTKCDPRLVGVSAANVSYTVEDFSGDPFYQPKVVANTLRSEGGCVRASVLSVKPGLAIVKLIATNTAGGKQLEHSFLVGWMAIGSVALSDIGPTTLPAGAATGDRARVLVNGVIPINDEFQVDWGLTGGACPANVSSVAIPGGADCLTMPTDWRHLAEQIASTSTALRSAHPSIAPSQYWDIHDSSGPAELGGDGGLPDEHISLAQCPLSAISAADIDQVDNCRGGNEFDGFSRVFGDLTSNSIGPFDPQRPGQTLLSDGNLNALDAPMPPLRIDYTSTPTLTDADGNPLSIGAFDDVSSDKHVIYSRNHVDGPASANPHNLYAPFYASYIPATSVGANSTGTDGPTLGGNNNFEGYLNYGPYHFWDIASTLVNAEDGPTRCLVRTFPEGPPRVRNLNSGPQQVAVYTDEHGEAQIEWLPGVNADVFGTLSRDMNQACDIEGLTLGGAVITALARYPNQNVALPVAATGSITKTVTNLFRKAVSCVIKDNQNPAGTGGLVYICTATAQDVNGDGRVFNGERVCIGSEDILRIRRFPLNGQSDIGEFCQLLDGGTATSPAFASVEFSATHVGAQVNVYAFFENERLFRDTCITVGESGPTGSGPCGTVTIPSPGGGGGGTDNNNGGNTNTSVQVVSPANSTTKIQGATTAVQTNNSTKAIKASVVSVRTVKVRNGRALVVRVQSPNKTATIRVVLAGKNGKVLGRAVRTIPANKAVRVQRLLIPRAVKAVHVSVLR